MEVFIDKIENNIAELHFDENQVLFIDIKKLPNNIKEGSYLTIEFFLNNKRTEDVKNNVKELINELSINSDGGDFEL